MEWYFLVMGTVLFATAGAIIEKKTLFKEHAMEFCTVFSIFTAVLTLPLWFFLDFSFPTHYWVWLILLSWIDSVAFLYIAKASRHMQISSSSPLLAFGPVLIAIMGFFFLGESLTLKQMGGIGLVLFGSYVLELKPRKKIKDELTTPFKVMLKSKYVHYIFIALALYSVASIATRFFLNTSNPNSITPLTFTSIIHLLIAINMVILISFFHDGIKGIKHGIKNAGNCIALVSLVMISGRILLIYAISMPTAKIALVSALKRTSSLFSTIFGGEIFHDKRLKQKTIAAVIMVMGSMLVLI